MFIKSASYFQLASQLKVSEKDQSCVGVRSFRLPSAIMSGISAANHGYRPAARACAMPNLG